ncbi:class I SAM-dependent DNA methyltransferase [Spirochaeta lutea]|uniref:class I SAM-dependent DNA methyltransferase n=1 Tax=Spirochaeta lutea TaxID=1480694 RepID=UPI000690BC8D|nr:class I SAM-dependent methyltransferase [Spirochaeta lutea]
MTRNHHLNLYRLADRPAPFAKGSMELWRDPHISKGMLQAHLDPDTDAASRRPAFLDASCRFIQEIAPPDSFPRLLDLGCGPGLYAQRLLALGYDVTGVDFSEGSIGYAASQNPGGRFLCQDYTNLEVPGPFDLAMLIYCDFGVLAPEDRRKVIAGAFEALRPGGLFILDVETPVFFRSRADSQTWYAQDSGFFMDSPHVCLESLLSYPDNLHLERYILVPEQGEPRVILNWHQAFTPETLKPEFTARGFELVSWYSDVAGQPFLPDTPILCGVFRKPG